MPVTVTPLEPYVGAEITGTSARDLVSRRAADDCLAALQQYGVLLYRDVHIDDDDLSAFSRMLGEGAVVPTGEHVSRDPDDHARSVQDQRTARQLPSGQLLWHIDGATEAVPQKATLLSARGVDDTGGDTEFASTYAAYDALPQADKARPLLDGDDEAARRALRESALFLGRGVQA